MELADFLGMSEINPYVDISFDEFERCSLELFQQWGITDILIRSTYLELEDGGNVNFEKLVNWALPESIKHSTSVVLYDVYGSEKDLARQVDEYAEDVEKTILKLSETQSHLERKSSYNSSVDISRDMSEPRR